MFDLSKKARGGLLTAAALALSLSTAAPVQAADAFLPECYRPASPDTAMLTTEAKEGPYRVALVNGFFGIPWRTQMIQSLKAWANRPENAKDIEELRIVSVGNDVAAQIAAIDNFIQVGFDAIIFIAVNPSAFNAVIRRAEQSGVLLVSFDNTVDSERIVGIQPSQIELEGIKAQGVIDQMGDEKKGKVVEIRGVQGNATDRDRHIGARKILDQYPDIEVIEVVGNWDQGTAQKLVSDLVATHGEIAGVVAQHGAAGAVNGLVATGHKPVPVGGDGENSFRLALLNNNVPGVSVEGSPGMSAIAMQAAIAMLKGAAIPESVHLPITPVYSKDLKPGENVFPDVSPSFNTVTGYAECEVLFTPEELSVQTPENM